MIEEENYEKSLAFYAGKLFNPDGPPRWMSDKDYPHDIHGAAQGIISFTKAALHSPAALSQAHKITDWTIRHLYRARTCEFAYRQGHRVKLELLSDEVVQRLGGKSHS